MTPFAQVPPHNTKRTSLGGLLPGPKNLGSTAALTRLELLAMLGALTLLAAIQLPLLARSREPGNKTFCANNLRRLGAATLMFSADNNDTLPRRSGPNSWPVQLYPYFQQTNLLHCPSDAARPANFGAGSTNSVNAAPRSYLMNAFNDYPGFTNASRSSAVPLSAILKPSETILLGEKATESGHWWLDYNFFDDVKELEQSRHFPEAEYSPISAGSHYGMADGSVRFLRFGKSLHPVNLWFIDEEMRGFAPF